MQFNGLAAMAAAAMRAFSKRAPKVYTPGGNRELGRYGTDSSLHGNAPCHWLQRGSHKPGMLPNHCVGLPSDHVSRGASIVTRHEANTESW